MKITRYYLKQAIELGQVRGIRGVLLTELKWQLSENVFHLYYPGEELEIKEVDKLSLAVKDRGKPNCVFASFKSNAGETLEFRTCGPDEIIIEIETEIADPNEVFSQIEPLLGLIRISEVPARQVIRSAFIAHAFDDEGRQCAGELSHFLDLMDIKTESGRTYAPQGVAEKVRERLARHDMFIAVITPQEDPTWLIQECVAASLSKKPVFLLKRDDAQFKSGILSDLEYIPFPKGQISRTFVHILEGMRAVQ
jgi:hypothetical protein